MWFFPKCCKSSVIILAASLKLNNFKNYSGEFFKEKAQKFSIEIEAVKNETKKYQNENQNLERVIEILKNENSNLRGEAEQNQNLTEEYKHALEISKSEIEESNNLTIILQQEADAFRIQVQLLQEDAERNANETKNLKSQIEILQEENRNASNCSFNQLENISLEPAGNFLISLIRKIDAAQEIDICAGTSTDLGYFTAKTCCQADQKYLFDPETHQELTFAENSVWIEDNICLINTTEISKISVPNLEFEGKQTCLIDIFDGQEFIEYQLDVEIKNCFNSSCSLTIDVNMFQNLTILNGTSIACLQSNHFGIITKSKSLAN